MGHEITSLSAKNNVFTIFSTGSKFCLSDGLSSPVTIRILLATCDKSYCKRSLSQRFISLIMCWWFLDLYAVKNVLEAIPVHDLSSDPDEFRWSSWICGFVFLKSPLDLTSPWKAEIYEQHLLWIKSAIFSPCLNLNFPFTLRWMLAKGILVMVAILHYTCHPSQLTD